MRIVDDDSLCLFTELFLKVGQIQLKGIRIRSHFNKHAVIISDICSILQKIRCKYDDLLTRIHECLQAYVQCTSRTDCHDQIVLGKGRTVAHVQIVRDRLAHLRKSGITHIAVHNNRIDLI